jgi:CheY-like chemotaxis protein
MSTLLLVGEDELLQQTRAAVLRTVGANVTCSDPDSALSIQQGLECDLVVLCHSLPEQLAATIAKTIRSRWPATRILLVTSSRIWEAAEAIPTVDAVSSPDPEHLIERTIELLGRRQPRSVRPQGSSSGRISA